MGWVSFIIIGILVGWVAGLITKGKGHGLIGNLIIGVVGAIAGGFMFDLLNIQIGGQFGSFIMAVLGAVAVLYILKMLKIR